METKPDADEASTIYAAFSKVRLIKKVKADIRIIRFGVPQMTC